MSFAYVKTSTVIQGTTVTHRFRWQAERDQRRRQERLETRAIVPSMRWEVVPSGDRWAVALFQNKMVPPQREYLWELESAQTRL